MKSKFSREQDLFLNDHYSNNGAKWCTQYIPFSQSEIRMRANNLKLTLTKEARKSVLLNKQKPRLRENLNLDTEKILSFTDPKANYLLGFLWGDGWVTSSKVRINFEFIKSDYLDISSCFDSWGKWYVGFITTKKNDTINRKEAVRVVGSGLKLYNFLVANDYLIKSQTSPVKLLSIMPTSQHHLFWRGYIDADGCWYFNAKQPLRQFSIAGTYSQDWTAFQNLCYQLGITPTIKRRMQFAKKLNKMTGSSICRITNKNHLKKLGEYIYTSEYDSIGLKRKYQKYLEIYNSVKKW